MKAINLLELEQALPESTTKDRMVWARLIVEHKVDMLVLVRHFIDKETVILSRFLWLLSDIGSIAPHQLYTVLPMVLEALNDIDIPNVEATFANYWLLAGIPIENEARAIDLLMYWMQSPNTNISTKSRAISVIQKQLIVKYPDLINEFKLGLESQLDKHTPAFQLKVRRALDGIS